MSLKRSPRVWILITAMIVCAVIIARAQQPKVEPKTLNPIASARIIEIETQIAGLRSSERDVLDGAGVPRDWNCGWNAEKIVTCVPAPQPVASPSPKE